jgi:hypothetical protein
MKVGGTASITYHTNNYGDDGVSSRKWMGLEANGLHFFRRNPLYFFHNDNSKNFDELGVKAQKFAGIVIGSLSCRILLPF